MATASVDRPLPRRAFVVPVRCTARAPSRAGSQAGWSRNVDEGGVCLVLPERLRRGQRLQLSFPLAGGALQAEGRVVWVGPPGFDLSCHGMVFTRLAPEARRLLRALLLSEGPGQQG